MQSDLAFLSMLPFLALSCISTLTEFAGDTPYNPHPPNPHKLESFYTVLDQPSQNTVPSCTAEPGFFATTLSQGFCLIISPGVAIASVRNLVFGRLSNSPAMRVGWSGLRCRAIVRHAGRRSRYGSPVFRPLDARDSTGVYMRMCGVGNPCPWPDSRGNAVGLFRGWYTLQNSRLW